MTRSITLSSGSLFLALLLAASCEGPAGPEGATGATGAPGLQGPEGPAGPAGEDGEDGKSGSSGDQLLYVYDSACQDCHAEIHARWSAMGHAQALTKVRDAKPADPPTYPYPADPPSDNAGRSYSWQEVTTIVGGFAHAAVFTDEQGYLITGAQTRYDLASGSWTAYEPDVAAGSKQTNCGACHTTGYKTWDGHETLEREDNLEGMAGAWVMENVSCENDSCHGRGSAHNFHQGYAPIKRDRAAALCAKCHSLQPHKEIAAAQGLITSGQQWNEIGATKMRLLDCVDCHDPHTSAVYDDGGQNSDLGIVTRCETCHYKMVGQQQVAAHLTGGLGCLDCHMPRAVRAPMLAPAPDQQGAIRSHLFRINAEQGAPQFSDDGSQAHPYLTVEAACRQCHQDLSDAELAAAASGYHD